jgi:hypothetical protein
VTTRKLRLILIIGFYSFSCSLDQSYGLKTNLDFFNVKWVFHLTVLIITIVVAILAKIKLLVLKHTYYPENEIMTKKILH